MRAEWLLNTTTIKTNASSNNIVLYFWCAHHFTSLCSLEYRPFLNMPPSVNLLQLRPLELLIRASDNPEALILTIY